MTLTILALLLLPGAASASELQPPPIVEPSPQKQAAALYHQSATEYELGNFEAALGDIAKAYRLDPLPALLFNLGQCHRALHHWERAAFFYREYLHKNPGASNRAFVGKTIAEMEKKQEAEPAPVRAGPQPLVLVEAPPPAVAAPIAAPSEAVAEPFSPPPPHGHALGIGLLSTGLAFGVLTGLSALEVIHYNGAYAGAANQKPGTLPYNPDVSQAASQADVWQAIEIVSAILGVAGVGAAAFVW